MTEFQGHEIVDFEAKIPSTTVDAGQGFKYGTKIRLAVEVRVSGIHFKENKEGLLQQVHNLSIEDIQVVSSYAPGQEHDTIGGDLSGGREMTQDEAEELGVTFKRTSDVWPEGLKDDDGIIDLAPEDIIDEHELDEEDVDLGIIERASAG